MINFLKEMYDILMPRYLTENVAMCRDENGAWFVLCRESDLTDADDYECIAVSRCFNMFGTAVNATVTFPEGEQCQ